MKCFATGTRFDVAAALDDDDFDATTTDDDRQKKLNDLLGAITKLVNFLDQDEVCLSIAFLIRNSPPIAKVAVRAKLDALVAAERNDNWRRAIDSLPSINSLRRRRERIDVDDDVFSAAVDGDVTLAPSAAQTLVELVNVIRMINKVMATLPKNGVGFLTSIVKKKKKGSFSLCFFRKQIFSTARSRRR